LNRHLIITCAVAFATVAALAGGTLAHPRPASASVLLTPPPTSAKRCVTLQLWYRSADGGPRTVRVTVARGGRVVARRSIAATTRWRRYTLVCPRPGTYTTKVTGAGWGAAYRTRVAARPS
jgi:hypothetical protein